MPSIAQQLPLEIRQLLAKTLYKSFGWNESNERDHAMLNASMVCCQWRYAMFAPLCEKITLVGSGQVEQFVETGLFDHCLVHHLEVAHEMFMYRPPRRPTSSQPPTRAEQANRKMLTYTRGIKTMSYYSNGSIIDAEVIENLQGLESLRCNSATFGLEHTDPIPLILPSLVDLAFIEMHGGQWEIINRIKMPKLEKLEFDTSFPPHGIDNMQAALKHLFISSPRLSTLALNICLTRSTLTAIIRSIQFCSNLTHLRINLESLVDGPGGEEQFINLIIAIPSSIKLKGLILLADKETDGIYRPDRYDGVPTFARFASWLNQFLLKKDSLPDLESLRVCVGVGFAPHQTSLDEVCATRSLRLKYIDYDYDYPTGGRN